MSKKSIHIIGGGIIGLCSAFYLNKAGVETTIIDKSDLKEGTSHGNAGMIVPSHFVPLASPGVIAQGIKWMFNSKSPFYIKPRISLELGQWLWKFYRSCTKDHVKNSTPVLFDFNNHSKVLYQEFSKMEDFNFAFEEKGLLMLYKSSQQEKEEVEMADKANEIGVEANIMSSKELEALEPNIKLDVKGGLYFPGDAHLYPNLFMDQLRMYLVGKGVKFITSRSVTDFSKKGNSIEAIQLDNGETINIENVLIASGSWTSQILKKLGIPLLLQDGKGYSITQKDPSTKPSIPTILSEAKVAITPMGNDLRIGGTLEISNFSKNINKKRLEGIIESVPKYYPDMPITMPKLTDVWYGYRPCTPDGMPYIDRSSKFENMYIGTGHGMMGMSLGPSTGKMIAELFTDQKTTIPNHLMRLNRF